MYVKDLINMRIIIQTSVIQGQKHSFSNSFYVDMISWIWEVIKFAVCVAGDEYDPLEVLGCCLIVHRDYLCMTMYNFINQSDCKIYVKVNNICLGTATGF